MSAWRAASGSGILSLEPNGREASPRVAGLDGRSGRAMSDDSRESLGFLYGRIDYERLGMPAAAVDLRVGRMRRLLRALGDPQDGLRIVHVAGTKGKGSTSYLIAEAARGAGYKAGLFTSPHLHRVEERFRVDGREASPDEFIALIEAVRPSVERLDRDPHFRELGGATFFEITTAMGLVHFRPAPESRPGRARGRHVRGPARPRPTRSGRSSPS